jgi:adenylylsulfate kinase-like enzyme
MKKNSIKIHKDKGILFWITGLSGSGKTAISRSLKNKIENKYGPTLILSGDDFRNTFTFKKYDFDSRLELAKKYLKFLKILIDQKINVVFAVIAMIAEVRKLNRKIFRNYIEIFINTEMKYLKKKNKKNLYKKNYINVVGRDIKAELPKNYDIKINNNFKKDINLLATEIFLKINKKIKK